MVINLKPKKNDENELNISNVKSNLGDNNDIKIREIVINDKPNMVVNIVYIDGLSNSSDISDFIIKPIITEKKIKDAENLEEVFEILKNGNLYYSAQKIEYDLTNTIQEILNGDCALIFDSKKVAIIFDIKKFEKRGITEPSVESSTKGPKDAFVENFRTNTAILRRKIKNKELTFESMIIGKQTNTPVSIVYMKNIVNDDLVQNVKGRINKINPDKLLSTEIIEDTLSEDLYFTFPQVVTTERPDKFCADLLEGRVGIIADGIPFGFIVPGTFVQFMQTPEDYSRKTIVSSLIRIIRFLALLMSLFTPAIYIAMTTFHPEMMPTNLALFIAKSREGVTFPIAVETLLMLVAFEILFEAGVRIPKTAGQAVSIVGTLVVGQAAVAAKLVSPAVVVIIAITSIASFAMPNQDFSNAIRIWRVIFTILSTILGLLGIVIGIIVLVFKLCKLEIYGISYMSPFVSGNANDMLYDTILRVPDSKNKQRPTNLNVKNKIRYGEKS